MALWRIEAREKGGEKGGERDREFIARQNIQSLAKIVWTRGWRNPQKIKTICHDALTLGVGNAFACTVNMWGENNQSSSEL